MSLGSFDRDDAMFSIESVLRPPVKITVRDFAGKKKRGVPISMLTAYDYPSAKAVDAAGFDSILVGDSLGMVVLGYPNTLAVTMDDMIHHAKAVARGAKRAFLVGDLPFMSYQANLSEAIHNSGRFLQEGGMDAVKLEGGQEIAATARAIVAAGIPVMGHLGLTPQSINQLGGFKVQGRTAETAAKLLADAQALEKAGCFAVVLESIPARLAMLVSKKIKIPTIGIGAGADCDGQVLVYHDLLGLYEEFAPKFVKRYARMNTIIGDALSAFRQDVEQRAFPAGEHTYDMPEAEWKKLMEKLEGKTPSAQPLLQEILS